MDDDTTTGAAVEATGAEDAQPVPAETDVQPAADPTTAEPGTEDTQDGEPAAPQVDAELQKYAESNGITLDSPGAIKAAEIARKAQSEATRNYQKASELEKAANISPAEVVTDATPQQQENVRMRSLELKYEATMWKQNNPEKAALEPQMVELLQDPNKKLLLAEGFLSYDDIYKMAKGGQDNSASVKSQGEREALQRLAHKQQAAVPRGNATTPTTTPKEKPFKDLSIAEMEAKLGKVRR